MKHILYIFAIIGLYITSCTDKESGVPPIVQPIGTGTYQPVASRKFYPPYFTGNYPAYGILEVYSNEKSFEYFYYHHPKAERVDASQYSIILASTRQTLHHWNIFEQDFYEIGDNRYVLVAHVYPNYCENWSMSALVPALPPNPEIGLLEIMHPQAGNVSSVGGNFELFKVIPYPEPEECLSGLDIIRTQNKLEEYFPGRTDIPSVDFNVHSLLVGRWTDFAPERQSIRFARMSSGEYVLSADRYFDPNGKSETCLGGYCVLVPAIPEGATVGILTTNYWIDGSPVIQINNYLKNEEYSLPASFSISDDIPDSLFVIRTQEDFDRFFSAYPEAATFRFDWYSLVIARGFTKSSVVDVKRDYYDYVGGNGRDYYEYAISVTLSDDSTPDTWYAAVIVQKLDPSVTPKLTVTYKNK